MILTYLMACASTIWMHRTPERFESINSARDEARFPCHLFANEAQDRKLIATGSDLEADLAYIRTFRICMQSQGWVLVKYEDFMDCITEFSDYDGCLVECSVN